MSDEIKEMVDGLKKLEADAKAEIEQSQTERKVFGENLTKQAETIAKVEKMVTEMITKQNEVTTRKGEFTGDSGITTKAVADGDISFKAMIETTSRDPLVKELQEKNDDLLIISMLTKIPVKELASFKSYSKFIKENSELTKALNVGTATQGAEWIPTGFSADLYDKVRLEEKVAALFPRINMPTSPYKLPLVSSDSVGYYITESTADDPTKITISTPGTQNVTLTAKKLAARVRFSEEVSEDSIIPIMPFVRGNIVTALGSAKEKAILNGDVTGVTHMDGDASGSATRAWDGLRYIAFNIITSGSGDQGGSTLYATNFMTARRLMGKYGVDPTKLAYIVAISTYAKMLVMNNDSVATVGSPLVTLDKYGAGATILKGELGQLWGSPVVVSEHALETMATNGKAASPSTLTSILSVYRPGFVIGDRRLLTVKTDVDIQTDQQIVVATQRLDFEKIYGAAAASTDITVYNYYNVATT